MHVVFSVYEDNESRIRYTLERIDVSLFGPGPYCALYQDRLILFRDRFYLNGELVSTDFKLVRTSEEDYSIVNVLPGKEGVVKEILHEGSSFDPYNIENGFIYVCESDGLSFDLAKRFGAH